MSAGRYESHFLRAVDPDRPRGVWIRYTSHQRPGQAPTSALWCTYFDAERAEPYAVKEAAGLTLEGWPDAARGSAAALGREAAWDLTITGDESPLRHLPRDWMYRAKLPRTKLESPRPAARFDGLLEIGGERIDVRGWAGALGHNWGAEHAATWVWLHGIGFGEDAWLDLSAGRVRLGPVLSPWIANGALHVDGRRFRLGGPRPAKVQATPRGCRVDIPGAVIEAIPGQMVAWEYADPGGAASSPPGGTRKGTSPPGRAFPIHHSLNSSIAELRVVLDDGRELRTSHGGVYEHGTTDLGHGIPVQPFSDG